MNVKINLGSFQMGKTPGNDSIPIEFSKHSGHSSEVSWLSRSTKLRITKRCLFFLVSVKGINKLSTKDFGGIFFFYLGAITM